MVVSADETMTKNKTKTQLFVRGCNDAARTGLPSPDDCLKSEQRNLDDRRCLLRNATPNGTASSEELRGFPSTAARHEREGKKNPVNYMLE